jgi:hypothetical protein
MADSMIVRRLKNTKDGSPYALESRKAKDQDHAEKLVTFWWASKGSMAVVILTESGKTDSHYMREYCDPDRVPKKWLKYWAPPPVVAPALLEPTPEPRAEPDVTLFNEDSAPEAPKPHSLTYCGCCGNNRVIDGYGERDRSPSGRLNDGRCPQCGKPLQLKNKAIYRMYMNFLAR